MKIFAVMTALASLGCGYLAAQPGAGGKSFTLRGTVVDGVSNRPLAGVEVNLQTEKWDAVGDSVTADAQGQFLFGGLAAGEYILSATGSAFGTVHYGEAPDPGWVNTVHVGAGSEEKSIVFKVMPRASMEGVVRDEFGDPMMRANVLLLRPLWRDGTAALRNVSQKFTDDRGRYRFANLAPGNYIVCTGGSTAAPLPGPVDFASHVDNRVYTRTCYPTLNGSSYRTTQLAPGQHAQFDLAPVTGSAVAVRGHVRTPSSQMRAGGVTLLPEEVSDGNGQNFSAVVDPQGAFVFRSVAPGHYRLRADLRYSEAGGTQKQLTAEMPVDVGSSDLDGLDLVLDSGGVVDVEFHGLAENRIDPAAVGASLRSADASRSMHAAPRDKDGFFHFDGLPAGRYWLNTRTEAETCVESAKVGDRDVRATPLTVAAGASLHVDATVSRNCGAIVLRALRDTEPVPGAKVVLLVSGTPKEPGDLMEDFANDEGEFSFFGLTPGRYLVWTWAVEGPGAITGPSSLEAVETQATTVDVKPDEPVHVDVPLLKDEAKAP